MPANVTTTTEAIVLAAEALVAAITRDDSSGGGLITRETIRAADELRVILMRWRGKRPA